MQAQAGFDDQIEDFATDLTGKIVSSGKKKIAVAAFAEIDGTVTQFGNFLTDELSAQLAVSSENQTKFEVIERANLEQIFTEHKLAMSGIIDGTTAKELGKIKAADAIVVGAVTPMGETYRVTIKVLDTETGNIVTSSKGQIVKTPSLQALQDKIVRSPKGTTPPKPATTTIGDNKPTDTKPPVEEVKPPETLGSICFVNNEYMQRNMVVQITSKQTQKTESAAVRAHGGKACFTDLPYGTYTYVVLHDPNGGFHAGEVFMQSSIKIAKEEETITIR